MALDKDLIEHSDEFACQRWVKMGVWFI